MNTRRFPRTLSEAFGPYETGPIFDDEPQGYGRAWWAAVLACSVAGLVLALLT